MTHNPIGNKPWTKAEHAKAHAHSNAQKLAEEFSRIAMMEKRPHGLMEDADFINDVMEEAFRNTVGREDDATADDMNLMAEAFRIAKAANFFTGAR